MAILTIRGAITLEDNTKDEILDNTRLLLETIIEENNLNLKDIIQISFTATKDITAAYPAIAAREIGLTHAALMCMQEMDVEGSLTKCIRVAVMLDDVKNTQYTAKHQYLKGAHILRPDLIK